MKAWYVLYIVSCKHGLTKNQKSGVTRNYSTHEKEYAMLNEHTPIHDHSNMFCGDCGRLLAATCPDETVILPARPASSAQFEIVVYQVFHSIDSETGQRTEHRFPVSTQRLFSH